MLSCASAIANNDSATRYNQVSFTVSAEAEIANDRLVIIMKALQQGNDLESLADEVNRTMSWALETAAKMETVKAQTLNYQTQPIYSKGKPDGWQVSQSLSLSSTSSKDLSQLMGKLQSRMQVESASYEVTPEKKKQLEDRLTTQALTLFSLRADSITKALQRRHYKIVMINLNSSNPGYPRPMMSMARGLVASESVTPPSFEAGTQTVTVTASGTIEALD
jgi:predicted secreted protein